MSDWERENTESHQEQDLPNSIAAQKEDNGPLRRRRAHRTVCFLAAGLAVLFAALVFASFLLLKSSAQLRNLRANQEASEYILENYASLVEAAQHIQSDFIGDVDTTGLKDGAIRGMIDSLGDKWSYYVSASDYEDYLESSNNEYVGIGVSVTKEDGAYVLVKKVSEDSPAAMAGILAGDMICQAEGEDLKELSLEEVKAKIRGLEGTFVNLRILREDGGTVDLSVQRKSIIEQTVTQAMLEGNIGYIHILNFGARAAQDTIDAIKSLTEQGAGELVFDVRFNGGGRLSELLTLLDYLLPRGDLFVSEDKSGEQTVYTSDVSSVSLPMAVLVNDSSFSAAEFFAAALQEYEWAKVIGQHTTGKGYSQIPIRLADGSAIVLSTREYLTPQRVSLANVGVKPDVEVPVDDEEYVALYYETLDYASDTQLQAAIEAVLEK